MGVDQKRQPRRVSAFARHGAALGRRARLLSPISGVQRFLVSELLGRPTGFITGWRRMWTIFHAAGATNVVWVWCPNAIDQPAGLAPHWTTYYPGDHYVDWVAVDGYNHSGTADRTPLSLFMGIYNDYHTKKPIMIAETAALEPNKVPWITSLRHTLKRLPDIAAVTCFDQNNATRGWDWRITTTPTTLTAYQHWATDPYYDAR